MESAQAVSGFVVYGWCCGSVFLSMARLLFFELPEADVSFQEERECAHTVVFGGRCACNFSVCIGTSGDLFPELLLLFFEF